MGHALQFRDDSVLRQGKQIVSDHIKVGDTVIIHEVRFATNSEYIGHEGIVTTIYPHMNGLISVKVGPPFNRSVAATSVRSINKKYPPLPEHWLAKLANDYSESDAFDILLWIRERNEGYPKKELQS